jgi:hypothetical protein
MNATTAERLWLRWYRGPVRWWLRAKTKGAHAGRAWRYLTRRLTKDDAAQIAYEVMDTEGEWPLACLNLDSVLSIARDKWQDHPDLIRLAEEACHRVWYKWSSTGTEDAVGAAEDWALDLIAEYAETEGIDLVLTEAWQPPTTGEEQR